MLSTLFLVLLILFLIGGFPAWPHSKSWGYGPVGLIGTILILYLAALILGMLPVGY